MEYNFKILADSSCDLTQEMANELGLEILPLSLTADDKIYHNYLDGREIGFGEYYDMLRKGTKASTSAVNIDAFQNAMEPILKEGYDLLYIGFSSSLSSTYQSSVAAAAELREKYPERTILTVDSLSASMGYGLLVYLAVKEQRAGKSIQEVADYVEGLKMNMCHWFTVDDLHHLRRGGRLNATSAIIGTALKIKPVMHMDDDGKLTVYTKARGRKTSINMLVKEMEERAIDPEKQTIFISHGDCLEDAQFLAGLIREKFGISDIHINYVGPVIGTHSGPGTLALFFIGKVR